MDLEMTSGQRMVLQALSTMLARECPMSLVREAEASGFDDSLWKRLQDFGVLDIALAEGLLDAALIHEELGRCLAPVPLLDATVASRVLGRPAPGTAFDLHGDRLCGAAGTADSIITLQGDQLVLVGMHVETGERQTLGSSSSARWSPSGGRTVIATGAEARQRHARASLEWFTLAAARLVGATSASIELGVRYLKERYQFGVPIGSFQSLQHAAADAATSLDGAQALARKAAWALDSHLESAERLALSSFVFASDTAQRSSATSLHFHGGYGVMLEYDIQLYFRRAKEWSMLGGDPRHIYRRIGRMRPAR